MSNDVKVRDSWFNGAILMLQTMCDRGWGRVTAILKPRQNSMNTIVFVLILASMLSCAPAADIVKAPEANVSRVTVGNIDMLVSALDKNDFAIKPAPFIPVDLIRLYEAGRLASACGNNVDAPYKGVFGALPEGVVIKDIHVLSNAQEKIGEWLYGTPGLIQGWQINPDEALVLVTKTPPECAYFSYCGFIFYKYYDQEKQRKWIFSSYNNPLNNLTIKTAGTPDGAKGNPFNQDTIIIITADRGTDQRVRKAAVSAGYSENIINTYVIPSPMVKMGIGPEYDTMVFGHRVALFDDAKAGQQYVESVGLAFRVTPKSQIKPDPFQVPELRVRGTGKTEVDLQPVLDELRKAILAKHSDLAAKEFETSVWLSESYDAVQRGIWVGGESRDTVYLRSDTFTLGNDPNEFVIVYGVNHAATGKATYSNCSFYGDAAWNGVAGIYSTEYTGSAEQYLPGNPLAKYLYVCKFARYCSSDSVCKQVPTGPKSYGVKLDEPAFIAVRAYMEPATKVGPAYAEILYERVIKFDPKK